MDRRSLCARDRVRTEMSIFVSPEVNSRSITAQNAPSELGSLQKPASPTTSGRRLRLNATVGNPALARRQSRPPRPIQDSMIVLEMSLMALTHNAQSSRDRAFAGRHDRSNQRNFGVRPNGLGEQRREFQRLLSTLSEYLRNVLKHQDGLDLHSKIIPGLPTSSTPSQSRLKRACKRSSA
jgi:hypothetical protein